MKQPLEAYIGLGSNLDDPIAQVETALEALRGLPESRLLAASSLYRSRPMGPQDQPDYINAVARIETRLDPVALLDTLQAIEQRHGRVRSGERWGARTLDLDLLLYGDQQIASERLVVPHPGIHLRPFVLYPLQEVAAGLEIVGFGSLERLLSACPPDGLIRLDGAQ